MKRALVLAGGGMPGWMYEVGVLTALDDFFIDFSVADFDIYVGTSAGAAVAALLANRVKPHTIFRDLMEDRPSPFNFQRGDIYGFNLKETFPIIKKFARSLFPILRHYFKNRRSLSRLDLLHMLQENLPSGLFTLDPLDRYLERFFSTGEYTNDFRKLKKELYIPAVDLDLARYDVFGEGELVEVPISRAVIASSAMPILFHPVTIKGRDYIDGGVGRVAYMDIAMNHGATMMVVVNPTQYIVNDRERVCLTSFSGQCAGIKQKGFSFIYDQAMRINTQARLYFAIKRYKAEHPEKDFLLLQPKPSEVALYAHSVMSFAARREVLRYGYSSTVETLKEDFANFKERFSRQGIRVSLDRLSKMEVPA